MSEERQTPTDEKTPDDGQTPEPKARSLFRNYLSFAGAAIAAAGFVSIVLMLLLEFMGGERSGNNPYTAIFTYILFPSVMGLGLAVALLGMLWERRRRRRMKPDEIGRY